MEVAAISKAVLLGDWKAGHFVIGVSSLAAQVQTPVMDLLSPPPSASVSSFHTHTYTQQAWQDCQTVHKKPAKLDNIVQPPHIELWWALFEEINFDMISHNPLTQITELQSKE